MSASGESSPRERVVICGAGIAGVSAAYFLSRAGIKNILLLDQDAPLSLTSDRSTECYRNWWPDPALLALMNRSITLLEELAAASANRFRMNRRGYLYLTADSSTLAAMEAQASTISELGGGPLRLHGASSTGYKAAEPEDFLQSADGADLLLDRQLILKHFPYLSDRVVAALHVRRAGWLSAQQLGMYMLETAREMGVQYRRGRVHGVELQSGRVRAAVLGTGEAVGCDVFINAAGPFFPAVGAMMGLELPVEAEVHLKVAFEDSLRVVSRQAPLLIWTDSQILPWRADERALFEADEALCWLTAEFPGGAHTRPEGGQESGTILMLWDYKTMKSEPLFPVPLDQQYPEIVLRGLATMLPGLERYVGRAARPKIDGGYYMRTRENRPLVGPTRIEGVYLLGALSGFGIMSAAACGELLAAHINGKPLPSYAADLALGRYDDPEYAKSLGKLGESGEL